MMSLFLSDIILKTDWPCINNVGGLQLNVNYIFADGVIEGTN